MRKILLISALIVCNYAVARFPTPDPLAEIYYAISPYAYALNNPIKYVDPDGRAVRVANIESFNTLLSSLPEEARGTIVLDNNNFIDANSVNTAYAQFSSSGNMQALNDLVADSRIIDFNATATSFNYIDSETRQINTFNFEAPSRVNWFQNALNAFGGTPADREGQIQFLQQQGYVDEVEVSGTFGIAMRPWNAQQPYPGGRISTTNDFGVYVNPVGTTRSEKAKYVGHELFGHTYFSIMGKDPRHSIGNNPDLDEQIFDREKESERNSQY